MADSARVKLLVEYAEQGDFTPPLALTYDMPTYEPSEPQVLTQHRLVLDPASPTAITIALPPQTQLVVVTNRATSIGADAQDVAFGWTDGNSNLQAIPPGGFVAIGGPMVEADGIELAVATNPTAVDIVIIGRQDPLA
jgi:hypothetical protein